MESGAHLHVYQIYNPAKFNDPKIIPRIQDIQFTQLVLVDLDENEITSIETLHRANMPNLKELSFGKYWTI